MVSAVRDCVRESESVLMLFSLSVGLLQSGDVLQGEQRYRGGGNVKSSLSGSFVVKICFSLISLRRSLWVSQIGPGINGIKAGFSHGRRSGISGKSLS